ncbi:MAG: 50S ribosomal protein L9 [Candidatus Pacebacteria bacterium]|nr:50S ribosomal protein L9 [Candidatus Paceibacterota bacterium]
MKVILFQDIEKLGKKFEIKNVERGYARNYLIPRNLAKVATKKIMQWAEVQREINRQKEESRLKETQDLISKINQTELRFALKVGDKGQLFEALTAVKIKTALKERGFDLLKSQIKLEKPIKAIGEFSVDIEFDHNLSSTIRIVITKDE